MSPKKKVYFVSLGCPKNRVDAEIMLGHLQDAGLDLADDPEDADVIVVNTCGFIDDAKRESVEVIIQMAQLDKKLIVTGCLAQRFAEELAEEIPEIDVVIGSGEYVAVAEAAQQQVPRIVRLQVPSFLHTAASPRVNTFLPHAAYVKVAEGCDQQCSFCIIPKLRGPGRSRTIADLVEEAQALAARGIVELNLIAQDLTAYGLDLEPRQSLAKLLKELAKVDLPWIRLLYAYPRPFSDELLETIASSPNVLPYIDLPLQHIADPVLKRMQRGRPRKFIEALLERIRQHLPDVTMRSAFIVGFPGETESDFLELMDFADEADFDHAGVFRYSHEEGTAAFELDGVLEQEVIDERYHRLMELLKEKSAHRMSGFVERRLEVLVDGPSEETELLLAARHRGQAPEIDGTTYLNDGQELAHAGDLVEVTITEAFDYDLVGRIEKVIRPAPPRPDHPRLESGREHSEVRGS